ncbi:hypothetical protein F5876DRAFT_82783 [Lentinula aff. lateritia]|uniref:Uncharacterized protein n=1 Tax=Lentinula aff. lateritia TaxID=2804960 RepID=A0ACC1TJD0_9AGAR|nr:hypothetical protein F5876DRAFT_82783 [Lentinula aff. lateritia]
MSRQPGNGIRWTNSDCDAHPSSIFQELVVLLTLAPQLSRPEYADPTSPFIPLPQPRNIQEQNGVIGVFSLNSSALMPSEVGVDEDNDPTPADDNEITEVRAPAISRNFAVSIIKKQTVTSLTTTGKRATTKATMNTLTVPGPNAALLDLDRCTLINDIILGTVNGQIAYVASPTSGPSFSIFWKGLMYGLLPFALKIVLIIDPSGDKGGALAVLTDGEWVCVQDMICIFPKLNAVNIIFDITDSVLVPYRRADAPLAMGSLTPVTQMTATQLASESREAADQVPSALLENWGVRSSTDMPVRSRGTKGPCGDVSDLKTAIMEGFGFAAGAMMHMSALQSRPSGGQQTSALTMHHISRKDELDVCVDKFASGLKRKLPDDFLDKIKEVLKEEEYDVELLGQGTVTDIAKITGLKAGPASGLRAFAKDYGTVLKGKHARLC